MLHPDHETRALLVREHQATLRQEARRVDAVPAGTRTHGLLSARRHTSRLREQLRHLGRRPHATALAAAGFRKENPTSPQ